jgi:hypothetical protein
MKALKIKILFFIVFLIALTVSCSAHCDDEDYRKEKQEKKLVLTDTLKTGV